MKPAIATRPCLISAWRSQALDASSDSPISENCILERLSGSKKPMAGFCSLASSSRLCAMRTSARGAWTGRMAGANAAAEAERASMVNLRI